jgi:hypothetical protein
MIDGVISTKASPNLTLDFRLAVDAVVGFSRATSAANPATYVNSAGYIAAAQNNAARIDFDPISLASNGLLIEEPRTNLALQSENFSVTWVRNGILAFGGGSVVNAVEGPDNTLSADLVVEAATTSGHFMSQTITTLSGFNYTFSVFAKPAGRDWVCLEGGSGGGAFTVFFNVASGAIGNISGTVAANVRIEPYANGFYRCSVVDTTTGTAPNYRVYMSPTNGVQSYLGDGLSGVYLWGAQLELGAFPTSYMPTTTVAVTRNADLATITAANFNSFWRAGKGAALVRARPQIVSGIRPVLQFDDATANNIIALRGNATNPELYVRTGGVDQAQIDAGAIAASASYRLAGAWAANDCAASFNSSAPVLDGVATIPTVTQARIGSDGTNYLNGHIEAIEYYDERLPSASLQVLSSQAGRNSIIGSVFRDSIIS